jgi:Raf kinase inhibitor-like YbhB/YbcL family protein
MREFALFLVATIAVPTVAACAETAPMLTLTSPAFVAGQPIPRKYSCEGDDRSPPLRWSGAPAGTKSFALVVDDPDAPDPKAPRMTWVHWVLFNVPATVTELAEGVSSSGLPAGTVEARNDFARTRFGGPCPPIGRHRYFHKIYALDAMLPAGKVADKAALEAAMKGHVLAQAELIGTYQKGER